MSQKPMGVKEILGCNPFRSSVHGGCALYRFGSIPEKKNFHYYSFRFKISVFNFVQIYIKVESNQKHLFWDEESMKYQGLGVGLWLVGMLTVTG